MAREPLARPLAPLALAALGVVFGDIGTSPLYTLTTCFSLSGASAARPEDVLGIASLLVWVLVVVVCLKYITFILPIDHDGEGGILALLARASKSTRLGAPVAAGALTVIVVVGAAMLLGDGAITPAISVISAIEGLGVATPVAHPYLVPLAIAILIGLFALQPRGTERVGRLFGPVMVVWFATIALAGLVAIASHPAILAALDPRHAARFIVTHGPGGFFVLGGVVLAVTGVEALYADLSHFGRRPIVLAWYGLVFPALVLCYVGEAARVLADPKLLANPFYALTPGVTLLPAIAIATLATVILLTLVRAEGPAVDEAGRVRVEQLRPRLTRVVARFGYMEPPRIEPIVAACRAAGLELDTPSTSYFYADPKPVSTAGETPFLNGIYLALQRNARPLPDDLGIPAEQRVEIGVAVRF